MKTRFSTLDLQAIIAELKPKLIGMRLANLYDIDSKTYLLKMARTPEKATLLIESGIRMHLTEYDWPKNDMPSGFAMKCRKHLRTKRLSEMRQLGCDRIIDLTFGSGEATNHLILELFDRGNIALTDDKYGILSLLRPRVDNDDVRFAVGERYPYELAKPYVPVSMELLVEAMKNAQDGEPMRKYLNPIMVCGPAVIEHAMLAVGFAPSTKIGKGFDKATDMEKLLSALVLAENMLVEHLATPGPHKGYIIMKKQVKLRRAPNAPPGEKPLEEEVMMFEDFLPFMLRQFEGQPVQEFESFDRAVDTFFSELEAQNQQMKALQAERAVIQKLENVRINHENRLLELKSVQQVDMNRAALIENNLDLVDQAIRVIRAMVANALDWGEIAELVDEAKQQGDPVARVISKLHLDQNTIELTLTDPFASSDEESGGEEDAGGNEAGTEGAVDADGTGDAATADKKGKKKKQQQQQQQQQQPLAGGKKAKKKKKRDMEVLRATKNTPMRVKVSLDLTAYANAREYYDNKRHAAVKEQKTIEASEQALRNAEKKTALALKETELTSHVQKSRKVYWFEKFLWFISSENYLIIAGRDRQQNEMLVRRYLRKGDIYVHADIHGAASVIIKNPAGGEVPPRTLNEAGNMAIVYSSAWDAKVVTSAYWVHHDQVSKTAPSGEYLTTGSFMIRGKKNFLPPGQLIMGFGLIFKLDDSSVARHVQERKLGRVVSDAPSEEPTQDVPVSPGESDSDEGEGEGEAAVVATEKQEAGEATAAPVTAAPKAAAAAAAEEEEMEFPDTVVELRYERGDSVRIETQSSTEVSRQASGVSRQASGALGESETTEGNGDGTGGTAAGVQKKQRLSAKQKRLLKKKGLSIGAKLTPEFLKALEEEVEVEDGPQGKARAKAGAEGAEGKHEGERQEDGSGSSGSESGSESEDGESEEEEKEKPKGGKVQGGKQSQQQQQQQQQQKGKAAQEAQQQQTQQAQQVRGKKGKQKKMKEKYADQDEEERAMRMQLLKSEGPEVKLSKKDKRKQRKEGGQKGSKHNEARGAQQTEELPPLPREGLVLSGDAPDEPQDPISIAKAREEKRRQKKEAKEEVQKILDEEGVFTLEDDEKETLSVLDSFTGTPYEDDVLMFAIPMCGPYSAFASAKYKAKVTPGSGKKGKAIRGVVHSFMALKETSPRERDLIKALKDEELFRNIPSGIRVMVTSKSSGPKKVIAKIDE